MLCVWRQCFSRGSSDIKDIFCVQYRWLIARFAAGAYSRCHNAVVPARPYLYVLLISLYVVRVSFGSNKNTRGEETRNICQGGIGIRKLFWSSRCWIIFFNIILQTCRFSCRTKEFSRFVFNYIFKKSFWYFMVCWYRLSKMAHANKTHAVRWWLRLMHLLTTDRFSVSPKTFN